MLIPALAIGFGLFLLGVLSAYFYVIPTTLQWFHEYFRDLGIPDGWRIGSYIGFVTSFCLIFGISFELPVVVMVLVKLGLLSSTTMRRTRSWAMTIVVASAIITPTGDILTLSLLAGPMIVMYEICIWLAVIHEKKLAREEADESSRDMARRAAFRSRQRDHRPPRQPGNPVIPAPITLIIRIMATTATRRITMRIPIITMITGTAIRTTPIRTFPPQMRKREIYRREHAHLYETSETHPEETPLLDATPTEGEAPALIETKPETPGLGNGNFAGFP